MKIMALLPTAHHIMSILREHYIVQGDYVTIIIPKYSIAMYTRVILTKHRKLEEFFIVVEMTKTAFLIVMQGI